MKGIMFMANGKEHLFVNTIVGTTYVFTFYNQVERNTFLYVTIGMLIGGLITPDYDLETILTKEMIKKVPIIGRLWCAYWKPYADNFTHRGVSHDPIIGTLTRAVYGFWWLFAFFDPPEKFIYYVMVGWYIQDFSHYILDLPFSKWLKSLL